MEKFKIMLVDDEKQLLSTTKKLFDKIGIDLTTCDNGEDALHILDNEIHHVVFLDIKMPEMDGIEVLRRIKKKHPLTEVIILTGHGTMDAAVDGLKSGAMDFLVKPLSMKDFLEKAEEAFEKYKRQELKIMAARKQEEAASGTWNEQHEEVEI